MLATAIKTRFPSNMLFRQLLAILIAVLGMAGDVALFRFGARGKCRTTTSSFVRLSLA